jgi:hypothetical protein
MATDDDQRQPHRVPLVFARPTDWSDEGLERFADLFLAEMEEALLRIEDQQDDSATD